MQVLGIILYKESEYLQIWGYSLRDNTHGGCMQVLDTILYKEREYLQILMCVCMRACVCNG